MSACFRRDKLLRNYVSLLWSRHKSTSTTSAMYCMDIVRKSDYENYLSILRFPTAVIRTSAFAVNAFNVQIAQVFDVTSNRDISQMRLQFWRDALNMCYAGTPPEQPVAQELARAVARHNLTKRRLKRLIDGRVKSILGPTTFANLTELEEYCDDTVSAIYYLYLEILNESNESANQVSSLLGKANGIGILLRSIPFHGQRSQVHIPTSLLAQHKVSEELIIRGSREQKVRDLVCELAISARSHLQAARKLRDSIPNNARYILLPSVAVENYLDNLEKINYDVFHPSLRVRNNMLPLQLLWRQWRGF